MARILHALAGLGDGGRGIGDEKKQSTANWKQSTKNGRLPSTRKQERCYGLATF